MASYNVNIVTQSEIFMLVYVRTAEFRFSDMIDTSSPERSRSAAEDHLLLRQWLEVEDMLVERGSSDPHEVI
jgi:hypothetical protein